MSPDSAPAARAASPFQLQRFVIAQDPVYATVLAELRAGRKHSHWMWFIFPQLKGLGRSATALHYGLAGADVARAYAAHRVLGARLHQCAGLLLAHRAGTIHQIMGAPDDLKLRSSMTLFEAAGAPDEIFSRVLDHHFDGRRDERTLQWLAGN